jgi:putative tricarboxylic transport membrane protein
MDRRQFLVSTAACAILGTGRVAFAQDGSDYPSKPIELVTHNQPGAVMDIMSRIIADIVQQEGLLSQPIVVVNKPGAGGGAMLGYLLERRGDPHVFMASPVNTLLQLPLTENLPYTYKDFTPIANLVFDGSLLVVSASSPYNTIEDLIADAKARPGELNMSITSLTGSNGTMARQIMRTSGVEYQLVTFASNPESVVAVINGTVDFTLANPGNVSEHIRAGSLKPLLTASSVAYPAELAAPLMEESGLGKPRVSYRGFFGPPEMPDYAHKKMEDTLKAVFESKRFQDYMAENYMTPGFIPSGEYSSLLDQLSVEAREDLIEAGEIQP